MTVRRGLAAGALIALVGACGGTVRPLAPTSAFPVGEIDEAVVPSTLLGLRVKPEDVSRQFAQAADRAFVTALRMWSLRERKRLRATIEVARFAPDARPDDPDFQRAMLAQLGKEVARLRRVSEQIVYVTSGNSQALFVWFRAGHLVLMSVSSEFPRPRALLRAAIEKVAP